MFLKYLHNILIATDQWFNAILGGDPDMTISGRVGRNYKGTWIAILIDFLFSWQKREGSKSHVENAAYWESDEGKDAIIAMKEMKDTLSQYV